MASASIGILGGGAGGIIAANLLRKAVGREVDVVLIERETDHYFQPSYLWAMTGSRRMDQLRRPLGGLARKGIEVVTGKIEAIDPVSREVTVAGSRMQFDHLVVSLGAQLKMDALPGLSECRSFYTFNDTDSLRKVLQDFRGGPIIIAIPSMPYKCPAAPYEAAFLIEELLRKRGLRERSTIEVITVEPLPMPVAGPLIGKAIVDMLGSRGIGFSPAAKISGFDHSRGLMSLEGSPDEPFELVIAVPPHSAPSVVTQSGMCDETGWVPADAGTLRTSHENVYAIGDVTAVKLPNGKFLPKAGVFAHYQAETVASNIAELIGGQRPDHVFDGYGQCFLEIGGGKAGYASGQFYAKPNPAVRMRNPSRRNHWAKIWFEKYWWWRWL